MIVVRRSNHDVTKNYHDDKENEQKSDTTTTHVDVMELKPHRSPNSQTDVNTSMIFS